MQPASRPNPHHRDEDTMNTLHTGVVHNHLRPQSIPTLGGYHDHGWRTGGPEPRTYMGVY